MKKLALSILGIVLIGLAVVASGILNQEKKPSQQNHTQHESEAVDSTVAPAVESSPAEEGRFTDYSTTNLRDGAYSQNVLFFHASWCPECRAYEKAITSGNIPANTQILKVNFDSSTDLKKQYGVTLQSTFVAVDKDGNSVKKWVGYGKEKSVATILTALYGN